MSSPAEPPRPLPQVHRAPRRPLRFAPVSDALSTPLRVAAGYFTLTGATAVLGGAASLVAALRGAPAVSLAAALAGAASLVATGGGALWTAWLLERRRRLGGVVAIATLVMPAVQWWFGRGPAAGVLFSLVGAAVVAATWTELE